MKATLVIMSLLCSILFTQKDCANSSSTLLKYHIGTKGDYILFFNTADSLFYFVQTTKKIAVPKDCKFASYTKNELKITDAATQSAVTYTVGGDIIGLSRMGGPRYFQAFTVQGSGNIQIDPNPDTDIWALACKCVTNDTAATPPCQSGGPNSSGCEIADGGALPPGVAWNNHCQVSCNAGSYACCVE